MEETKKSATIKSKWLRGPQDAGNIVKEPSAEEPGIKQSATVRSDWLKGSPSTASTESASVAKADTEESKKSASLSTKWLKNPSKSATNEGAVQKSTSASDIKDDKNAEGTKKSAILSSKWLRNPAKMSADEGTIQKSTSASEVKDTTEGAPKKSSILSSKWLKNPSKVEETGKEAVQKSPSTSDMDGSKTSGTLSAKWLRKSTGKVSDAAGDVQKSPSGSEIQDTKKSAKKLKSSSKSDDLAKESASKSPATLSPEDTRGAVQKSTSSSAVEDSKKSIKTRWLKGPPTNYTKPFEPHQDKKNLKKSLSSSAVGKSLKKSVSLSSLGRNLKRAASKLSLSGDKKVKKSDSTVSVKTVDLPLPTQDELVPIQTKSQSSTSLGANDIGETVKARFVWDHGGTNVFVCVMQNGIKKSYKLLKENEGYHTAQATLFAGRCEFRYIVDSEWTHDQDLPALKNDKGHYNNQVRIRKPPDEGIMCIKIPRADNLERAKEKMAEKEAGKVEAKRAEAKKAAAQSRKLKRCLSGDETLVLSTSESNVLSQNDTLMMSDDGDLSDDDVDIDETLPIESSIGSPLRETALFLTEVDDKKTKSTNPFEENYEEQLPATNPFEERLPVVEDVVTVTAVAQIESIPALEIVKMPTVVQDQQVHALKRPPVLESHFAYVTDNQDQVDLMTNQSKITRGATISDVRRNVVCRGPEPTKITEQVNTSQNKSLALEEQPKSDKYFKQPLLPINKGESAVCQASGSVFVHATTTTSGNDKDVDQFQANINQARTSLETETLSSLDNLSQEGKVAVESRQNVQSTELNSSSVVKTDQQILEPQILEDEKLINADQGQRMEMENKGSNIKADVFDIDGNKTENVTSYATPTPLGSSEKSVQDTYQLGSVTEKEKPIMAEDQSPNHAQQSLTDTFQNENQLKDCTTEDGINTVRRSDNISVNKTQTQRENKLQESGELEKLNENIKSEDELLPRSVEPTKVCKEEVTSEDVVSLGDKGNSEKSVQDTYQLGSVTEKDKPIMNDNVTEDQSLNPNQAQQSFTDTFQNENQLKDSTIEDGINNAQRSDTISVNKCQTQSEVKQQESGDLEKLNENAKSDDLSSVKPTKVCKEEVIGTGDEELQSLKTVEIVAGENQQDLQLTKENEEVERDTSQQSETTSKSQYQETEIQYSSEPDLESRNSSRSSQSHQQQYDLHFQTKEIEGKDIKESASQSETIAVQNVQGSDRQRDEKAKNEKQSEVSAALQHDQNGNLQTSLSDSQLLPCSHNTSKNNVENISILTESTVPTLSKNVSTSSLMQFSESEKLTQQTSPLQSKPEVSDENLMSHGESIVPNTSEQSSNSDENCPITQLQTTGICSAISKDLNITDTFEQTTEPSYSDINNISANKTRPVQNSKIESELGIPDQNLNLTDSVADNNANFTDAQLQLNANLTTGMVQTAHTLEKDDSSVGASNPSSNMHDDEIASAAEPTIIKCEIETKEGVIDSSAQLPTYVTIQNLKETSQERHAFSNKEHLTDDATVDNLISQAETASSNKETTDTSRDKTTRNSSDLESLETRTELSANAVKEVIDTTTSEVSETKEDHVSAADTRFERLAQGDNDSSNDSEMKSIQAEQQTETVDAGLQEKELDVINKSALDHKKLTVKLGLNETKNTEQLDNICNSTSKAESVDHVDLQSQEEQDKDLLCVKGSAVSSPEEIETQKTDSVSSSTEQNKRNEAKSDMSSVTSQDEVTGNPELSKQDLIDLGCDVKDTTGLGAKSVTGDTNPTNTSNSTSQQQPTLGVLVQVQDCSADDLMQKSNEGVMGGVIGKGEGENQSQSGTKINKDVVVTTTSSKTATQAVNPHIVPKESLSIHTKKSTSQTAPGANVVSKSSGAPKDIFHDVNKALVSIEKSRSRSDLYVHQELQKSASKSRFLEEIKHKKEVEQKKEDEARRQRAESEHKTPAQIEAEKAEKIREAKEKKSTSLIKHSRPTSQYEDMPKKLDEVLGPIRDAPASAAPTSSVYIDPDFDPGSKEISGITETVKLKKSERKPTVPEVKKEKTKFEVPGKPAKFPKLKPKAKEEPPPEPTPPPPPKSPTPQPPKEPTPKPKEPTPVIKEATPEKETTPLPSLELVPSPPPPVEDEETTVTDEERVSMSPTKILPPKIGINGFNGIGRLVLRAALEKGLEVKAVNDPFVPVHYMIYMLKFDIAHSTGQYHEKEMTVRESPTGQIVINGKIIQVFAEYDVTKIPWELAGVNYVVEATDALNTLAEAKLHLRTSKRGVRMRHLLELESNAAHGLQMNGDGSDPYSMVYGGCKRVVVAGPSPDAPLLVVGVNEDKLDPEANVTSHASAAASALAPVLLVINKTFGIKCCAYTLLRSIRGRSKDSLKCANLGPNTHSRSVKWDFAENLVPAQYPSLEEETLRLLPFMHRKLHGLCVYVPTPEVSMFDLTLQLEKGTGDTLYRDVCLALKEAASEAPLRTVMRYCMSMSADNSASSLFVSETHSCIVDAKSGCQVTGDTIKLVVWFDNEFGHAYRVVDLITQSHMAYCNS